MKSLPVAVCLLLALSLPACQKRAASPGEATYPRDVAGQTTGLGNGDATPVRIDASAVWSGSTDACRQAATPAGSHCVVDAMRSAGATPAAIAAAQRLAAQGESGYVSAWDDQSGVGVATLEFPLRANTNQGTWLVDASGRTIDVDADVLPDSARSQAQARAFFDRHPQAVPFAPAQPAGTAPLPDGGVRLLYAMPLRGCHACADDGTLTLGYDFDAGRRYIGRQVVEVR
ncbi:MULTISPECIES: hypothetical protein [Stenotrophomonas]|jgi:hypothetical protein|uniref:Lipoprotein n=1 Tax=Stenotrophomonas acidaminiphila TaxID=128780 RepID=A0A0S1B2B7_9GAMM|nr:MULTISPECIES: hypothetical protein [Stenotrophomonas]ALJ29223.1 hypothetical protein AOT14_28680 [Stenotrophomonas acidaminiphila]MCA7023151.1 hypothetical protein [Stenotrophomonas acidaminiphila]MCE4075706.1 hypothetical protein [Stenotrophomonas acidaminiphila]